MYIHIYTYVFMTVIICVVVISLYFIFPRASPAPPRAGAGRPRRRPGCLGAEYRTPEINTSEIIVHLQWYPWNFTFVISCMYLFALSAGRGVAHGPELRQGHVRRRLVAGGVLLRENRIHTSTAKRIKLHSTGKPCSRRDLRNPGFGASWKLEMSYCH